MHYPAIHTNYIVSHCTTLQYIHNIWHDRYLGRNEFLNTKDNEFNRVAISLLWHEGTMLRHGQINMGGIRRR